MTDELALDALVNKIVAEWADKGQLIEGGWQGYVATSGLDSASELQRQEMHEAYFVGAQHLFASIMGIMDPDEEPTEKDMARMSLIAEELATFGKSVLQSAPNVPPASPPTTTVPSIGDGPIQAEYRQKMNELAGFLDHEFNGPVREPARHIGFVLLVFPFHGHEGRANYISNGADRRDIVTLFTEQIARFKGSPDQAGRA